MEPNSLYAIIITIITVLGSAGAWKFYEKRLELKRDDDDFIRNDCAERIDKLEDLLERSAGEKDVLRDKVLELTKELAELSIQVKYLQDENKRILELNSELNRVINAVKNENDREREE